MVARRQNALPPGIIYDVGLVRSCQEPFALGVDVGGRLVLEFQARARPPVG
jgi:hypothetical protein